jgi:hypothetical protein
MKILPAWCFLLVTFESNVELKCRIMYVMPTHSAISEGTQQSIIQAPVFPTTLPLCLHLPHYNFRTDWQVIMKFPVYEGITKSFRTGRLEQELKMIQLCAIRCSCIVILWVILVSFAAITLCVASQRVFIVVVYFVTDSVRKLSDTASYFAKSCHE